MIMSNTNSKSSFIKNELSSNSIKTQSSNKIDNSNQVKHFFTILFNKILLYYCIFI